MSDVIAKSMDAPERSQAFLDKSSRGQVKLANVTIGRGVYRPGWRWSVHAGPLAEHESAAHVGYVVSGRMVVLGADGSQVEVGPGDAFEAGPGHDAWVVGEEPCIALDFGP